MKDYLTPILARTRLENLRRRSHYKALPKVGRTPDPARAANAVRALRRGAGAAPSVLAEIKFRSPSAGSIRRWAPGEGLRVAKSYEKAGAAAISVLADYRGFLGSPLQVRRIARAVSVPVLFKGFVLDPVQVDLAFDVDAALVLLLVRALTEPELFSLVARVHELGMEPVVEAADADEVERAVETGARIVGVNARDLRTFRVDMEAANQCLARVPSDRVAVFMSGIRGREDFQRIAQGRADAVLIGEGLMRSEDPGGHLSQLLGID